MSAAPEELASLLGACALRDREVFARLYRATSPKLFGVALRILKREDWAEEVLQDAYVSIWNHSGGYRRDAGKAYCASPECGGHGPW